MRKVLCFLFFCVLSFTAYAQVPRLINYQGQLTDAVGEPVDAGTDIEFRIFDVETGGTMLWNEIHNGIDVNDGVFAVILGSVDQVNNPLDLDFNVQYYLEMVVNGEVMDPRQQITSVGYAIRSKETDALPAGVIIMCRDACPAGYTRVTEFDGKALVGGSSYNPDAGSGSLTGGDLASWGTEAYSGGTDDNDDWILAPVVSHNNRLYASIGKKGWHGNANASPNLEVISHSSSASLELKSDEAASGAMDYGTIYLCEKQ